MPSSVVRSFEYDAGHCELLICFQSGTRYVYRGVPRETYQAMEAAFSKGEFFNTAIRGRFPFRRIDVGCMIGNVANESTRRQLGPESGTFRKE